MLVHGESAQPLGERALPGRSGRLLDGDIAHDEGDEPGCNGLGCQMKGSWGTRTVRRVEESLPAGLSVIDLIEEVVDGPAE
jgi:hypothetical protein